MIKHNRLTSIIYIGLVAVIDIVFAFFLPAEMVVQLHADGSPGTVLPTWAALGLVFVIALAVAYQMYRKQKYEEIRYWFYTSIVVFVLNVILIIFNL